MDLRGSPAYATNFVEFLNPSQETIDAVGPGKCAYQMTLASTHSVKEGGLLAAIRHLGATPLDPLRLCFVVPTKQFGSWKSKTSIPIPASVPLDTVRAYVVGVDATTDRRRET